MLSDKVVGPDNDGPSTFSLVVRRAVAALVYTAAFAVIVGAIVAGLQSQRFNDVELQPVAWVQSDDELAIEVLFRSESACLLNPFVSLNVTPSFETIKVRGAALAVGACDGGAEVSRTVTLTRPVGGRVLTDRAGVEVPERTAAG